MKSKSIVDELNEIREQIAALLKREAEIIKQMRRAIGAPRSSPSIFNPRRKYSPNSCGGRMLALLATGPKTTAEIHVAIPMTGTQAEMSRLNKAGRIRQSAPNVWELVDKPAVSPEAPIDEGHEK